MDRLLLVCLGGALGSGARYLVGLWVGDRGDLPIGTWTVNILGSFLLGLLAILLENSSLSPAWRLGLTTGLMGGFTTYSTFSLDTHGLMEKGLHGGAAINVVVTVVICLVASMAGVWLGRSLTS